MVSAIFSPDRIGGVADKRRLYSLELSEACLPVSNASKAARSTNWTWFSPTSWTQFTFHKVRDTNRLEFYSLDRVNFHLAPKQCPIVFCACNILSSCQGFCIEKMLECRMLYLFSRFVLAYRSSELWSSLNGYDSVFANYLKQKLDSLRNY